jgi:N-acetylmuramoyl-L-alanine amidase
VKYKPLTDVRYLVVHCAATPPTMDVGAKDIDRWHRERGFFSIGYHAVIRRDGTIENGRPLDQPGAHARGWNECSLGVCLVGGVKSLPQAEPEANFTPAQMQSLKGLLFAWRSMYPEAVILGHRDLGTDLPGGHFNRMAVTKACPSFDVRAWIAADMPDTPTP